ncbi:hypothetical protein F5Y05DRAFT_80294 [Hypoxylon sp. FL0543]|nr:hypothetical protein F5Y05DRAFT_80294 [Hypoxylon sp. FL0543]
MSSPSNELEIESKSKGLSKEALEAHNRENRSSVAGSSVPSTVFSRSISQMALSDIVDYAIKKLETETSPEKRRKLSRLLALAEIDAKDAEALKKKYQISDSSSARAPSKAPSKASSKDSTLSDLDSADFISAELASPGSPPGNQANSETRDTDQSVMGPPPKPKPKKRTKLSADKVPGPYCNTFIAEIIPVNASLDDILQLWSDRNAFSELYVTGKLKQMVRNLAICTLKGRAQGRYVRWEIKSGAFWVAAELNSSHRDEATLAPPEKAKPLYLDLADGGPIGRIMYQLYTDPRRVTGLYAQAWGLNNTAPCQCCENRYKTSESDKHTATGTTDLNTCGLGTVARSLFVKT